MEKDNHKNVGDGLDFVGLGKIAKAIPEKVYTQTSETLFATFNKLIAPITETANGLGRYMRQKLDNMVEIEKALGVYAVEQAIHRAEQKAKRVGTSIHSPKHTKSFIKSFEEAAKETDPLLHELWVNLLATQLVDDHSHPHFIKILSHFSNKEANILLNLLPFSDIGAEKVGYYGDPIETFHTWLYHNADEDKKPWDLSCVLLYQYNLASYTSPKREDTESTRGIAILYKTKTGEAFLNAVSGKAN